MKKLLVVAASAAVLVGAAAPAASAHNRAHLVLPTGECIIVGSETSVTLPDGTLLDLRPETAPADEIGTAFAADEGNSALEKGPCP
jgi:opacity protein-like surface antigen